MKTCPFCAEQILDEAIKCRYCGEFLDGRPRAGPYPVWGWGYEYRSKAEWMGWPVLHVAYGINPETGLPRVARGVIAVGNVAIGLVAVGGFAVGGLVLGGIAAGGLVLAGIGLGGVAFGGIALGLLLAVGGVAISAGVAVGGVAIAPRGLGGLVVGRDLLRWGER